HGSTRTDQTRPRQRRRLHPRGQHRFLPVADPQRDLGAQPRLPRSSESPRPRTLQPNANAALAPRPLAAAESPADHRAPPRGLAPDRRRLALRLRVAPPGPALRAPLPPPARGAPAAAPAARVADLLARLHPFAGPVLRPGHSARGDVDRADA